VGFLSQEGKDDTKQLNNGAYCAMWIPVFYVVPPLLCWRDYGDVTDCICGLWKKDMQTYQRSGNPSDSNRWQTEEIVGLWLNVTCKLKIYIFILGSSPLTEIWL